MFKIEKIKNEKFDEFYERAMKELDEFFERDWIMNRTKIVFVPDRKTYNSIRDKETDGWEIAFACNDSIYLLDPEAYEKDADGHIYSDERFFMLIKHELTHSFWNLFHYSHTPVWLSEGLALYLAGQYKTRTCPEKFVNFLDFYGEYGKFVYNESGFVVKILVEEFGKENVLELLKGLGSIKSEDQFYDLFERVYGFRISYDEMNKLMREGK
ncbi:hypothetical protein J4226_03950 [Candidatus Pacearchaeota archaeon]|nr:hypothetical protein [Candidatus Pacearchaeota archaeon]